MIVVDRPGIGATPSVPLEERVEVACRTSFFFITRKYGARKYGASTDGIEQVCSVLEHLKVKPAHLLAASAGV
jgi:hypothetical protein